MEDLGFLDQALRQEFNRYASALDRDGDGLILVSEIVLGPDFANKYPYDADRRLFSIDTLIVTNSDGQITFEENKSFVDKIGAFSSRKV